MAPLIFLTFYFLFALSLPTPAAAQFCRYSCRGSLLRIRFPFGINGTAANARCSYPGFSLSCNSRNQTILTLPNSGQFAVQQIDYETQLILLSDPDMCLPSRLIKSFNLSGSPFQPAELMEEFVFLSCPRSEEVPLGARTVRCLSVGNRTVLAVRLVNYLAYEALASTCKVIKTVEVPAFWPFREDRIRLTWNSPDCRDCEQRGGNCVFTRARGLSFGCSGVPRTGMSTGAKYGLIIGVGIPGLLCLVGLSCYLCSRARTYSERRHRSIEFSTSITPPPVIFITGLDGSVIDSYPKTLLGESRRLPKPNDNICPICLCEYQPKETLRTIPECNHYFHVACIDEWLRLNGSCPLCRNSPGGSALVSPSDTGSSSRTSTSSHSLVSSP